MIVNLVQEQEIVLETSNLCTIAFDARIGGLSGQNNGANRTTSRDKLAKFYDAFIKKFRDKEWTILAHINVEEPKQSREDPSFCRVVLEGDILQAVHETLYFGDESAVLRLEVMLKCIQRDNYNGRTTPACIINVSKLTPDDSKIVKLHCRYSQNNISVPWKSFGGNVVRFWRFSVGVDVSDFMNASSILPRTRNISNKIFAERKFCDLEIICDDGTIINCHKAFLCVQSPVLCASLEQDFKEKRTNQLKITDMSVEGVNAFLEFIYCHHIHAPMKSCGIALELLIAADKYDIPVLWKAVANILTEKSFSWFDIDVTLNLFRFLNKCARNESPDLKQKIVRVLAQKSEELFSSEVYQEMFTNEDARELYKMTLQDYKKA